MSAGWAWAGRGARRQRTYGHRLVVRQRLLVGGAVRLVHLHEDKAPHLEDALPQAVDVRAQILQAGGTSRGTALV